MQKLALVLAGAAIVFLVGLIFVGLYQIHLDSQKPPKQITFEQGQYSWEVYVGGDRQTWKLAYPDYDSLPAHNRDYPAVITYKGKRYSLWRVFSNQIRVSPPLTE